MSWRRKEPGHQQPYLLCWTRLIWFPHIKGKINNISRLDILRLCHHLSSLVCLAGLPYHSAAHNGSCSYLVQPLTLVGAQTLLIMGFLCSFVGSSGTLKFYEYTDWLAMLPGLGRLRVPVLWTVFPYIVNAMIAKGPGNESPGHQQSCYGVCSHEPSGLSLTFKP